MTANSARERNSWEEEIDLDPANGNAGVPPPAVATQFIQFKSPASAAGVCVEKEVSAAPATRGNELSVRAQNVLKVLAAELTAENPPRGRWTPSGQLLQKIDFKTLVTTRNCGPQTTDEIIRWAKSQRVVIERPFHAGKSLSSVWREIIEKSSAGVIKSAEIAEALDRSQRRRNTRIPVAIQTLLVKVLNSTNK